MRTRRSAVAAVVAGIVAVVLWWLSRDVVTVLPPPTDPPVEGVLERVRYDTRILLAATVSAGASMVLATLALLARGRRRDR